MPYATFDDLLVRFGETALAQLSDRERQAEPDLAVIGAALADASELIDGYAAARYRTPLHPVPAPVRRWCADIAYYYLHGDSYTETVRKAYEDAMAGLKSMASGVIVFQAEGVPTENTANGGVRYDAPDRVFTGGSMEGF